MKSFKPNEELTENIVDHQKVGVAFFSGAVFRTVANLAHALEPGDAGQWISKDGKLKLDVAVFQAEDVSQRCQNLRRAGGIWILDAH